MNISEQMNQLGDIGGVGYNPDDAAVDALVTRTRRARGIRQASAAAIGSVGALALGVIGAQIYSGLHQEDPAMRDRAISGDFAFLNMSFADRYGNDYTGLGTTPEALAKAWENLQAAAAANPEPVAPAAAPAPEPKTTTKPAEPSCTYEEHEWYGGTKYRSPETNCEWVYPDTFFNPWTDEEQVCTGETAAEFEHGYYDCGLDRWVFTAPGYFQFGNGEIYQCQAWTDDATGAEFKGALSDYMIGGGSAHGWEKKIISCSTTTTYTEPISNYRYYGDDLVGRDGMLCIGKNYSEWGASHQVSCLSNDALWSRYGTWAGANGENIPWTKNNGDLLILQDGSAKWFPYDSNSGGTKLAPRYYEISANPVKWGGPTYEWGGSSWVAIPEPTPSTS